MKPSNDEQRPDGSLLQWASLQGPYSEYMGTPQRILYLFRVVKEGRVTGYVARMVAVNGDVLEAEEPHELRAWNNLTTAIIAKYPRQVEYQRNVAAEVAA